MIFTTKKYRLLYRVCYTEASRKQHYNVREYRLFQYRISHTRIAIRKESTGFCLNPPDSSDPASARLHVRKWELFLPMGWHYREYIVC